MGRIGDIYICNMCCLEISFVVIFLHCCPFLTLDLQLHPYFLQILGKSMELVSGCSKFPWLEILVATDK